MRQAAAIMLAAVTAYTEVNARSERSESWITLGVRIAPEGCLLPTKTLLGCAMKQRSD